MSWLNKVTVDIGQCEETRKVNLRTNDDTDQRPPKRKTGRVRTMKNTDLQVQESTHRWKEQTSDDKTGETQSRKGKDALRKKKQDEESQRMQKGAARGTDPEKEAVCYLQRKKKRAPQKTRKTASQACKRGPCQGARSSPTIPRTGGITPKQSRAEATEDSTKEGRASEGKGGRDNGQWTGNLDEVLGW
ncbi:hypothetical protein JB92DRAFT_3309971 [Gautieria morchelliformis]|nr:hypothetical protein JB92DRAFT_3309971 [Gautieria morchelliformis]